MVGILVGYILICMAIAAVLLPIVGIAGAIKAIFR